MQHNDGKDSFLGSLLVASGVVERNCWMKQQSNIYIQGHLQLSSQFGCSAWGTEPNSTQQVWYVGIQ